MLTDEYAVLLTTLQVVDVNVCLSHVQLTSALHACDREHRMLAVR